MKPPLEHSHSLPQAPAIVNERHRRIMALLHQQTSLSVSQLAHMLGVSEVTIRKDLTLLEQQQMLYRVHGSAILANPYIQERHVNDKEKLCSDQKRAIGAMPHGSWNRATRFSSLRGRRRSPWRARSARWRS